MELLSTIHWVGKEFPEVADDPRVATAKVQAWSERKANLFKERDILAAWNRLHKLGWFKRSMVLN